MSSAVIFYSRSNNTRTGAEYIADKAGSELIELIEAKGRKGLTGFIKSGYQAVSGKTSQLMGDPWKKAEKHSLLYLMTPIWGGKTTPAMNAFLKKADFKGKEATVITFQADEKGAGSEGIYSSIRQIVENGGGVFSGGYAMHSTTPGRFAGKEYIEKQLNDKYFSLINKGE
jgi:flavodoxin